MERSASMINSYSLRERGERKRDFICPSTASSSQFAIWTCLSAECIRNVTRDEGMVDGASEVGDGGGAERAQKRAKAGLNVIADRGDKNANYQWQRLGI